MDILFTLVFLKLAFSILLAPAIEHDGVDTQILCHILGKDIRMIRQLDRLDLKLVRISAVFFGPLILAIWTPSFS